MLCLKKDTYIAYYYTHITLDSGNVQLKKIYIYIIWIYNRITLVQMET